MLQIAITVAALLVRGAVASNGVNASAAISLSPASAEVADKEGLIPEEKLQLTNIVLDDVSFQLTSELGNDSFSTLFAFAGNETDANYSPASCKTYAGDSTWPSNLLWHIFDLLLGESLLEVPPIASPCYTNWDNHDETECSYITDNFGDSHLHMEHPSSIMSPFYQGTTCMPIDGSPSNCTLGGYPYYIVNATNVAQIQLSVNFARNLNLRLVIKNTGHDFAGKSAGAGALSIWTHHFKSIAFIPAYNSSTYTGKAFKLGSGVQASEAYAAAKKEGVTIVGGEGQTVGVAGGYIQGGGHSPLSSIYGLAADSVLSYEAVTADGNFVTASDSINPDLYWALRGGGGSTFAVVTSVTVKAWPQIGVTLSTFTFTTSETLSDDTFWAACRAYWSHFLTFADAGAYGYFRIWDIGELYFGMTPFFAPNMTVVEHNALLKPWMDELADMDIILDINATYYDNFYDAWLAGFPIEAVGGGYGRVASRLFPRANWVNATLMNETFEVIKNTTLNGYYTTGFNMKMDLHPENAPNSANSHWRGSYAHALMSISWNEGLSSQGIKALSAEMTYGAMSQWRNVTPESGSYLGEADSSEPDWQYSFWGTNYARLLAIKNKWDPKDVFYALNAVGSERWKVTTASGLPTQDGKLCRVSD